MKNVIAKQAGYFDGYRMPGDVFAIPDDVKVTKADWFEVTKATPGEPPADSIPDPIPDPLA